ncbi:MAG TPA: hypothetical protein VIG62_10085 [Blastocatellia bacterium]|jgi:hypothetical protein
MNIYPEVRRAKPVLILMLASLFAFASAPVAAAQDQNSRFTDGQAGLSFQPPAGWTPEHILRYRGPKRDDETFPALVVTWFDSAFVLSDSNIEAFTQDLRAELTSSGFQSVRVTGSQKRSVAGREALQVDVTYQDGKVPVQHREVIVPASSQGRTYQFTFKDAAVHFDQSAAAAEASISSFTLGAITDLPAAQSGQRPDQPGAADSNNLLLFVVGALALIIVVGAAYLLLRRPAAR